MLDPTTIKLIGKAMMLASQNFAAGSILMSSTYSVRNFSKDSETLQSAADSLVSYVWVGALWTLSNAMVLGASYDTPGAVAAVVCNVIIMAWIWVCYLKAFDQAQKQYGLPPPKISLF